jgi:hypothetical protein
MPTPKRSYPPGKNPASHRSRKSAPKQLVVQESFAFEADGVQSLLSAGEVVPSDHPAVQGREELFAEAEA